MDSSIGQQKQNVVGVRASLGADVLIELIQKWSKVCWTSKADRRQCVPVSCKYLLDASWDLWILWITIDCKAMVHTIYAHVPRNTTEAEDWEALVVVIGLDDLANLPDCCFILVVVPKVVERGRL